MIDIKLIPLENESIKVRGLSRYVEQSSSIINSVHKALSTQVKDRKNISQRLSNTKTELSGIENDIYNLGSFLGYAICEYEECENRINNNARDTIRELREISENSSINSFIDEFRAEFNWSDILAGSGYIGDIYDFIQDIKNGSTWKDFLETGIDIYQFLEGARRTYSNYKRIGNAVGASTARAWWLKSIVGLKPLGRASTAKNVVTRFVNNLTNKTSPFNAQFKNVVNNFKGANGVGKAVASWGTVAVNGVMNWFSNKDEQANSNGSMSDGRVMAETITETAIDTALMYGAGIVVGAAVTAVVGPVAGAGLLVVGVSAGVVMGLNAGVKALTGKTTTEWVSDTILDTGEDIIKTVGNAAKSVGNAVGKWFGKLSFG